MKVKITKIQELEDALHPNNISVGYERVFDVDKSSFKAPSLGSRFNVGAFSSSGVREIIDDNTFKTYSSIYKWEIIN